MAAKIINNVEDRSLGINHQLFFEELKKDKNKYLDILKEVTSMKSITLNLDKSVPYHLTTYRLLKLV